VWRGGCRKFSCRLRYESRYESRIELQTSILDGVRSLSTHSLAQHDRRGKARCQRDAFSPEGLERWSVERRAGGRRGEEGRAEVCVGERRSEQRRVSSRGLERWSVERREEQRRARGRAAWTDQGSSPCQGTRHRESRAERKQSREKVEQRQGVCASPGFGPR
jgi:hypothetical protein